jgi:hypothetical protein
MGVEHDQRLGGPRVGTERTRTAAEPGHAVTVAHSALAVVLHERPAELVPLGASLLAASEPAFELSSAWAALARAWRRCERSCCASDSVARTRAPASLCFRPARGSRKPMNMINRTNRIDSRTPATTMTRATLITAPFLRTTLNRQHNGNRVLQKTHRIERTDLEQRVRGCAHRPERGWARRSFCYHAVAGITGAAPPSHQKTFAFAGLSCAREDSNLHGPYRPQGPQPCGKSVRCVRCVHFERFCPVIWTIWTQVHGLDVVKVLSCE